MPELFYSTVSPALHSILNDLMAAEIFKPFRLVGGTALSLHRGHRKSIDIDMFTDADYGAIDFAKVDNFLRERYAYVDSSNHGGAGVGMGKPYFVGDSPENSIKLDIFYTTEPFIQAYDLIDGVRLATVEEIIAMKLDVISRGGRKKDFWDIHELIGDYNVDKMLDLHAQRYEFGHDRQQIIQNLTQFEKADQDPDPVCLRAYTWEVVKLNLLAFAR